MSVRQVRCSAGAAVVDVLHREDEGRRRLTLGNLIDDAAGGREADAITAPLAPYGQREQPGFAQSGEVRVRESGRAVDFGSGGGEADAQFPGSINGFVRGQHRGILSGR